MTDIPAPVPKKGESLGTVAYRLIVLGALAITVMSSKGTYDKLDKAMDALEVVGRSITALNGRLDAQAGRLEDHDRRIGRLESPYFHVPTNKGTP